MSKQPQEESRFFLTFVGEYVQLTTNLVSKVEVQSEEGVMIEEGPFRIQAFLLDEDDKFYYLGGSPDNVTDAIKKITVKHIRIVPMVTKEEEAFDAMEPTGGVN